MRTQRYKIGLALCALTMSGAIHAQPGGDDAAALRTELGLRRERLEAAEAQVRELRSDLDAFEQRIASIEQRQGTSNPTQSGSARTPAIESRSTEIARPQIDMERVAALEPSGPIDGAVAPPAGGSGISVELTAAEGGGRASFNLTRLLERGLFAGRGGDGLSSERLGITLSAPLADDGPTTFATLDSLGNGTKLEVSWTLFSAPLPGPFFESQVPAFLTAQAECRTRTPDNPDCDDLSDIMVGIMGERGMAEYEHALAEVTLRRGFAVQLNAAVGYNEFAFYPYPILTRQTVDRVPWSVGSSISFFPRLAGRETSSISIGADYSRGFEAAKSETACPITIVPDTARCVTGALAAPSLTERLLLSLELRQPFQLSGGFLERIAIAPRIEIDALSEDYAIDVPIYLVPNTDGHLIGGLRFGYTSNEDDFVAGLFVGTRFSIFPGN